MKNLKFIEQILTKDELDIIAEEIGMQERYTSGEIRVSIKHNRSFFDKKKTLRDVAIKEFKRLKMFKTRDKNGILLLLVLKERSFYILPDIGITQVLHQNFWNDIAAKSETFFREGKFFKGILHIIRECGKSLQEKFPIKKDDTNELDNNVAIS